MKKLIKSFSNELVFLITAVFVTFFYLLIFKNNTWDSALIKALQIFMIFPIGIFGALIRWLTTDRKKEFKDYFLDTSFSTNLRLGALILSIPAMIIYIFFIDK